MMAIELPFPPSSLSGHANGGWRAKASITAEYRNIAREATRRADVRVPASGDILVSVHFYPPNNASDRVNFPNRMKPYFDGIADALGVNDKRFLPSFHFHAPAKPGAVLVEVE